MATRGLHPFQGSVVLKALGMAPLAVLAFRVLTKAGHVRDGWILAAALAFSCLGDVLLHVGARSYFLHAVGAFLLAHLTYIVLFTGHWPQPLHPSAGQLVLAAVVLLYGLSMCVWLWGGFGRLLVPALAYACAIVVMTVSTILAGFSRPFVWIGALLFLISDSLIAAGRFMMSFPVLALLIWPTYYLGQYGIAIGFLREKAGDSSPVPSR